MNTTKYTIKTNIPQYEPSGTPPPLSSLVDMSKFYELKKDIDNSNIPNDVKTFLRIAAMRHCVFNYSKIADYYANANKEVQELMEKSALVIIDIDDAIANGYVRLSGDIANIIESRKSDER